MIRQIGLPFFNVRRRGPIRPFPLRGNGAYASPRIPFLAYSDVVAKRLSFTEHEIKIAFARVYDDRTGSVFGGISYGFPIMDLVDDSERRREPSRRVCARRLPRLFFHSEPPTSAHHH